MNGQAQNPNMYQQDSKKQEFLQICEGIVPTISEAIDNLGGFCSLTQLSTDPNVMQVMATIPPGFPTKIKAVTDLFPDFISVFEGGRVATAKGYEEGLVNADGTVNPEAKKKKSGKSGKGKQQAQQDPWNVGASQRQNQPPVNMNMMATALRDAFLKGTDEEFQEAYEQACAFRKIQTPEAVEEAKHVIANCVNMIIESGKSPTMGLLSNREETAALAPIIGNKKLKKFIADNPDVFTLRNEPQAGNPGHFELVVDVNPMFIPTPMSQLTCANALPKWNPTNNSTMGMGMQKTQPPMMTTGAQGGPLNGMNGTYAAQGQGQQFVKAPYVASQGGNATGVVTAPQLYNSAAVGGAQQMNGFGGKTSGGGKGGKGPKGGGSYDPAAKRFRAA